jgi:hypothetical protein
VSELSDALDALTLPDGHRGLLERTRRGIGALEKGFVTLASGDGDQRFGRVIVDQAAVLLQSVSMLEELAADPADAVKAGAIELLGERFVRSELAPPPRIPRGLLEA